MIYSVFNHVHYDNYIENIIENYGMTLDLRILSKNLI